jgi:hypothetical protein
MNCERCGIEVSLEAMLTREARGNNDKRCSDCRVKPAKQIRSDYGICRPWRGEVDEDLNPIDNKLKPYMPGVRLCGHKDCVNPAHIMSTLEAERIDISYRTHQPLDIKTVMREMA